MNPILKKKGGKFYAKKEIFAYFPKEINTYIEPFVGGGSVFLNLERFGIKIKTGCYLNDLSNDVYVLWKVFYEKVLLDQLNALFEQFALYSQSIFEYLIDYEPKTDAERIFRLLSLTMQSYQGDAKTYYIGIGDINRKMSKLYRPAEFWTLYHQYLVRMNVKISKKDYSLFFQGLFNRKESFNYCDPPYLETSGYDDLPFTVSDQEHLCHFIHNFKGKAMLSLNKHDWVKEHYGDLYMFLLKTRWAGNIKSSLSKHTEEYLILNYDPSKPD